ncbi:MAG TPA: GH3 auxin-responsive promoter family protein [Dehalococcoidales bacterium]|nr:GH3 auxin-responsive promoter family protein [Dehalococcoidales bacterium]
MSANYGKAWGKYCGFLDLQIEQFMSIQEALLMLQLQRSARCPLWRRIIGEKVPESVAEFRRSVPLTSYNDYLPDLAEYNADSLPETPYAWAHTSDDSGSFKRAPYTLQFYNVMLDSLMAVFILACSGQRGRSSLTDGDRVLYNVAPSPYLSGILASGASREFNLRPVISPDQHDSMDFKEKVARGFEVSLQTGVDIIVGLTSVLVKIGNDFNSRNRSSGLSRRLLNPGVIYRLARASLRSKLEKRDMLPGDLWPVKALIGWGIDTGIYRELIKKYWGKYPFEFHACTEAGILAMQSWNQKDLTFIPHLNFLEFIPESEWLESQRNIWYQPRTLLLSEVSPGERYELVITSFYGTPFLRYRLGHLIRITSLADEEAPVNLPQMVFETRTDDLIDIAGFTRISEKTVAQAVAGAGFPVEEWSVRKEFKQGKPALHLYIELNGDHTARGVASVLHRQLKTLDCFYRDLDSMMDIQPLEVTLLRPGTFSDYYTGQKGAGAELSRLKPPRVNAPDSVIDKILRLSEKRVAVAR